MKRILKKLFYKLPASYALMMHHIDDGSINKKSNCVLKKTEFVKILDSGLRFISMEEFLTFSKKTKDACVLTFDDGLMDVYNVAYPELKKRNIPFTIFVVTDFLGTDGYIGKDELKALSADPLVTIGSHGKTHDILKGMQCEKQEEELLRSKLELESIISRPVKQFAYSHGQYDETTIKILAAKKYYDYAFSAASNPTNCYTKRKTYQLPRLNCEDENKTFKIVQCGRFAKIKMT